MNFFKKIVAIIRFCFYKIHFGKSLNRVPENSIIFFPYMPNTLNCGLSGILTFKKTKSMAGYELEPILNRMDQICRLIENHQYSDCIEKQIRLDDKYLSGKILINEFSDILKILKKQKQFSKIVLSEVVQKFMNNLAERLYKIIENETAAHAKLMGHLSDIDAKIIALRLEDIRDVAWSLKYEILRSVAQVIGLINQDKIQNLSPNSIPVFYRVNAVLNSIDRMEVRGRDSAGVSVLFMFAPDEFRRFEDAIKQKSLQNEYNERRGKKLLLNGSIDVNDCSSNEVSVHFTYKIAAEIGRLGDNIMFIRQQIAQDSLLKLLVLFDHQYYSVSAHTRWASVGAINEVNCHPQDNACEDRHGIIHVCLNGDIDNHQELKSRIQTEIGAIPDEITTDTKIIPMLIELYLRKGHKIEEAIRLSVNDFEGSHAIAIHTDIAKGKFYLAQRGSGQTIFIGLADEHYMPSSEVYGFVEETSKFIKMDGEKKVQTSKGITQGQVIELDQSSEGGLAGIKAWYYDGTPVTLNESNIKQTEITSRDIDRQGFPHYFLKEISEAPSSVEKTMYARWRYHDMNSCQVPLVTLDEKVVPQIIRDALVVKKIRRIFFVGQGTAGVAALTCANLFKYYLKGSEIYISAQKASEFSGFMMDSSDSSTSFTDTLLVAITQSGTTTDTNRTVDMVRARGAYTLAIVNRRDSDITFKVHGVMYTSSGRDIEMSVASTKAFYSQIIAGSFLGLFFAKLIGIRTDEFIANEIQELLKIPSHMRKVLALQTKIAESAQKLAVKRNYWAVVGSGANKAASDEIRIKLSELCYKTISSDYVEDKKHIDLSSEPLIIVCAAGCKEEVISDIVKDVAIFKAHKAIPVVIANEGETRFDNYADDVIHVPIVNQHLAPILNTLAGHLWGYNAALGINDCSRFLFEFKQQLSKTVDDHLASGLDLYEILLEKSFRENMAEFYNSFMQKKRQQSLPLIMGLSVASDMTLLLKYLTGRLPVRDFELDFGVKGTPSNMFEKMFVCLSESINTLARPVDAIKHQAKTVTVGTSRIPIKTEGILFDNVKKNFNVSQLSYGNVLVLRNLQNVVDSILGSILYKVGGLNLLGEPTEESYLEIVEKLGSSQDVESRVKWDKSLRGIKRIIVQQGNVFIGRGRRDNRNILVIPILSGSPKTPNLIENLVLLNISLKKDVPLEAKIKALGGKFDHIKNIVQEGNIQWQNSFIEIPDIEELFGNSAEKVAEAIMKKLE